MNWPQRKYIRLKGYRYDKNGAYFVTININNRLPLFGEVVDGKMILNPAGGMVDEVLEELAYKFPTIWVGPKIVMPDHIHVIIVLHDGVSPSPIEIPEELVEKALDADLSIYDGQESWRKDNNPFLAEVMQWFKTMTTNYYIQGVKKAGWSRFDKKLWQRGYYDRIIQSERGLMAVTAYTRKNPEAW